MAGILRWKDLQNIRTTEVEINLIAGLIANANDINKIIGFKYSGKELNTAFENVAKFENHEQKELSQAHRLEFGTLSGQVIAESSLPLNRVKDSQDILLKKDIESFNREVDQVEQKLSDLDSQIKNLYDLAMGINGSELPNVIQNLISHIDDVLDAHDATAISFGNYFKLTTELVAGSAYTSVAPADARFLTEGDSVKLVDDVSFPLTTTVVEINYVTGQI